MPRGNRERVGHCVHRGPQSADATVAQVVRVDHGRIVRLVIGDAFDVPRTAECRVDRHRIATRHAGRVGEGVGFEPVRSWETATRARLAGAGARPAIPANTILLRRITRRELAERDLLIWTAVTGRNGERDRLRSTRGSEIERKRDLGATGE